MAPYTPREPDDGAVTMHAFAASNEAGICTIIVTFCLPVPSSAYARYSVPAILPSPSVVLPLTSMFGSVQRAVPAVGGDVEQGAIVVVDRELAQLGRGRRGRNGDGRRGARKARLAEAGGEQVVGHAVIGASS